MPDDQSAAAPCGASVILSLLHRKQQRPSKVTATADERCSHAPPSKISALSWVLRSAVSRFELPSLILSNADHRLEAQGKNT